LILPHIQDLVAVCVGHGVQQAIISPGSRNAALSLAFDAHPDIETKVITDERSAAFIALGMAQQIDQPVVLVCTSGSASLNYAPAIAEAFYQEIPLLIITADRPPEWTNQYDGQTIQQEMIYGRHVKAFFQLPTSLDHSDALWHSNRHVNDALIKCTSLPKGPVHLNVPIREPFYPEPEDKYDFSSARLIKQTQIISQVEDSQLEVLKREWKSAENIWIIVGHESPNQALHNVLNELSEHAAIFNEVTGNQQGLRQVIQNQDLLFQQENWPHIKNPDLVITIGKSLISKNLKLYLRSVKIHLHWHIWPSDRLNDIDKNLRYHIPADPAIVLQNFVGLRKNTGFPEILNQHQYILKNQQTHMKNMGFGELKAMQMVLERAPERINIQLANSMTVRNANFINIKGTNRRIDCNRGTSGIDGSTSTAVGASIVQREETLLLTGDLAFFYDRNAFWNKESLGQLRIILFNNDGGGIFNMIPGPKKQKAQEKLFLTPHGLTAKSLAKEFGFTYHACSNSKELNSALNDFFHFSGPLQIIEVFSSIEANTEILNTLKSKCLLD
jgi:2-succinyl-5-enolpyruvyl-6-hydroxy-3-cyclohexene-1-carboxylate synthase